MACPAAAQENGLSPKQIGEIFCLGRLSNDMAPVLAITSPLLATTIAHAQARNDVVQRAAPDEKPPLGDGIPWQSYPDHATQCTVGNPVSSATMTGIEIDYGFPDSPEANFTDTLVLVPVPVQAGFEPFLRIDDVVYETGGTLVELLGSSFER
ncbi:MAG TPA: hypothetical protein VGB81_01880 [Devosia sp.]